MQIKLSFLGATRNVTGSRFLIEANGSKILVDAGLYQERDFQDRNWDPFPIPPSQLDAILLTHAHLDHCGFIPKLVHDGFQGKIYCTPATAELAEVVLLDSAKLQEEAAEYKIKRHQKEGRTPPRPVKPLYTLEDALLVPPLFAHTPYEQVIEVANGIEASFHDAGHILGASMIKLNVQTNGQKRTILFSGDVGRWNRPILKDPTLFDHADYVFVESTYGDRIHEDQQNIKDALAEVIESTTKAGGNILIPSFAIERAQEVLYYLNELLLEDRIPHLLAFLDSPMAARVTDIFLDHPELFDRDMTDHINNHNNPFKFPGLTITRTTAESKAINHISGTALIIAGSGMCNGGRIKHHLAAHISKPETTVLFVGYQASGTLGRYIVQGAKEVRILGQKHPIRARIERIHGFSGHADRNELFTWLSSIKNTPKKCFIIHGEEDAAQSFCEFLKEKTNWDITLPHYQDTVTLD